MNLDPLEGEVSLAMLALDVASLSDPATASSRVTDLAAKLIPCLAADIVRISDIGELRISASSDPGMSALTETVWNYWPHLLVSPAIEEEYRNRYHGGGYRTQLHAECGIGGELIFPLRVGSNDHGHLRFLFSDGQSRTKNIRLAGAYATHAALALDRAALLIETANLRAALHSSREIGAAIGILMERNALSYDDAFVLLRSASQDLNRKLRDVAMMVIATGKVPLRKQANKC